MLSSYRRLFLFRYWRKTNSEWLRNYSLQPILFSLFHLLILHLQLVQSDSWWAPTRLLLWLTSGHILLSPKWLLSSFDDMSIHRMQSPVRVWSFCLLFFCFSYMLRWDRDSNLVSLFRLFDWFLSSLPVSTLHLDCAWVCCCYSSVHCYFCYVNIIVLLWL